MTNTIRCTPASSEGVLEVRRKLASQGYAITSDQVLGLPADLHKMIDKRFFREDLLGSELDGFPLADRRRSRDVIDYQWQGGDLVFTEADDIGLPPRAGIKTVRQYRRVQSLEDPNFLRWLTAFLSLAPLAGRQLSGKVGVDFFRTFNKVVPYRHQDFREFICSYVTAHEGAGAILQLYPINQPNTVACEVPLKPGEWLMFKDRDFLHDVTPLEPISGAEPRRDVIVGTIFYPPGVEHAAP